MKEHIHRTSFTSNSMDKYVCASVLLFFEDFIITEYTALHVQYCQPQGFSDKAFLPHLSHLYQLIMHQWIPIQTYKYKT